MQRILGNLYPLSPKPETPHPKIPDLGTLPSPPSLNPKPSTRDFFASFFRLCHGWSYSSGFAALRRRCAASAERVVRRRGFGLRVQGFRGLGFRGSGSRVEFKPFLVAIGWLPYRAFPKALQGSVSILLRFSYSFSCAGLQRGGGLSKNLYYFGGS